jgi:hypothetical protein
MPPLPKRTGQEEEAFMKWALLEILKKCQGADNSKWQHPLGFLIDPSTRDWYARLGSRDKRATENEFYPPVQAGHLFTRKGLNDIQDQRFALEDADQNLEASYSGEGREARKKNPGVFIIFDRPAVDVEGVPAMLASVQQWERLGELKPIGKHRDLHLGWAYN